MIRKNYLKFFIISKYHLLQDTSKSADSTLVRKHCRKGTKIQTFATLYQMQKWQKIIYYQTHNNFKLVTTKFQKRKNSLLRH